MQWASGSRATRETETRLKLLRFAIEGWRTKVPESCDNQAGVTSKLRHHDAIKFAILAVWHSLLGRISQRTLPSAEMRNESFLSTADTAARHDRQFERLVHRLQLRISVAPVLIFEALRASLRERIPRFRRGSVPDDSAAPQRARGLTNAYPCRQIGQEKRPLERSSSKVDEGGFLRDDGSPLHGAFVQVMNHRLADGPGLASGPRSAGTRMTEQSAPDGDQCSNDASVDVECLPMNEKMSLRSPDPFMHHAEHADTRGRTDSSLFPLGAESLANDIPMTDWAISQLRRTRIWAITLAYLGALLTAEVVTNTADPIFGFALHLLIFTVAIVHGAAKSPNREAGFWLTISLIPLIRVVSLGLPLGAIDQEVRYVVVAIPLLAAAVTALRVLGITRHQVGFCLPSRGGWLITVAVAVSGWAIGTGEYHLLGPPSSFDQQGAAYVVLYVSILLVGTGLAEELIFRGILQRTATRLLGLVPGIVVVSVMFALMHIGHASIAYVAYAFAVSLYFGYARYRTESLLGVVAAHTVANVVFFIVMS